MGTALKKDIREEIKDYIDQADDRMVNVIHAIIEADTNSDWWDEISEAEKASIERGRKELKEGKGIPHEEVVKRYPQWFSK